MRILPFVFAATACLSTAAGADLSLKDGRVLRNAETVAVRPGYASIIHADGTTEVARELLPRTEARGVPALLNAAELEQMTEAWDALRVRRSTRLGQRQVNFAIAFDPSGDLGLNFITQWLTDAGRDDDTKPMATFHFKESRREEVLEAFSLFAQWAAESRQQQAATAPRILATIDGWDLEFGHNAKSGATLTTRGFLFAEDEVAAFVALLAEYPAMQAEFQQKMEAVRAPLAAIAELRPPPERGPGGRGRRGGVQPEAP